MFNNRLVISTQMQRQVTKQLRDTHPGMKKMKQLARHYFYWPNFLEIKLNIL